MQQASKKMLSFAQRSKTLNRMLVSQPQRGISLLVNDQFLDDDQKMIQ